MSRHVFSYMPKNESHVNEKFGKQQTTKITQSIKENTAVVGKSLVQGSVMVSQGVEKGISSFKKFVSATAKTFHLKKPDFHPLDELEKEMTPYLPTELAKQWYWKNVKLKPTVAKGNLVLNWTRVFCWHDDPFKPEILYPIDNFFVLDKEKKSALNRFLVKREQFGTVIGEKGSGKTTLLHWIQWELDAHHSDVAACFLDCTNKKISDETVIMQLMYPFLNVYQKTVSRPFEEMSAEESAKYIKGKIREKPFVLLIDHPYNITEKSAELFNELHNAGITMQIIVAGEKEALKMSLIGRGLRDTLKFELDGFDVAGTVQFLQKRIEAVGGIGTYPFDQQTIKIIHDHAKCNPLHILELAKEKVIQLSIDHQEEIVAQQQDMEKKRQEEIQKKILEEKQKRLDAREKLHLQREALRRKHMELTEKERKEEEERIASELRNEDAALEKIDEAIGSIIEKKGETKKTKAAKTENEEDHNLAKELEQVFAETEKAQKSVKKSAKK